MRMKHCFIMLDYTSLAAVAAVVREGSFERAAEHLGVTPSAVSQRVRGLEERLGVILVVRGQPCTATGQGRALCAHHDRVQLLEADLSPVLSQATTTARPPLRIAVNADSLATWFAQAAAAFSKASGHLLELALEDEGRTADRLRSGEVLAVVTSDPTPVQGCKTVALGALCYAACASPAFVAEHFADGIHEASLARAPFMRFDPHDRLQARWALEACGTTLSGPSHRLPSTHAFLDFALAGAGWGMHPVTLAAPHLASGALVELAPCRRIDVSLYWTVTRLHASALRSLTDAVRRVAAATLVPARNGQALG